MPIRRAASQSHSSPWSSSPPPVPARSPTAMRFDVESATRSRSASVAATTMSKSSRCRGLVVVTQATRIWPLGASRISASGSFVTTTSAWTAPLPDHGPSGRASMTCQSVAPARAGSRVSPSRATRSRGSDQSCAPVTASSSTCRASRGPQRSMKRARSPAVSQVPRRSFGGFATGVSSGSSYQHQARTRRSDVTGRPVARRPLPRSMSAKGIAPVKAPARS